MAKAIRIIFIVFWPFFLLQFRYTIQLIYSRQYGLRFQDISRKNAFCIRYDDQTGVSVNVSALNVYGVATGLIGVLNSILQSSPSPLHKRICCDRSSLFLMLPRIRRIRGSIHPF